MAAVVPALAATPPGARSATPPDGDLDGRSVRRPERHRRGRRPVCDTAATPCDDYALHVDVPAGYDADHRLRVDVSWPKAAADFDIYVLDASGPL